MTRLFQTDETPLAALRVVELPGIITSHLGKTLRDLGADVLKVEPPGGDPDRLLPPLAGPRGRQLGLPWTALNLGKKSISLDPSSSSDRDHLGKLFHTADVILTAEQPGSEPLFQIDPDTVSSSGSRPVVVALTPFGRAGPGSEWPGSDLVQFAMGGYLQMTGTEAESPMKPSAPLQTELLACNHALVGLLIALRRRRQSGQGAVVDQSMRDAVPWMLTHTYQYWDLERRNLSRQGSGRDFGGARARLKSVHRVKDGYIVWMFQTGHIGARSIRRFIGWMDSLGYAPGWLKDLDWSSVDLVRSAEGLQERLEEAFDRFFLTLTREEMLTWALENGLMLASLQSLDEVARDVQLETRKAWRLVKQPGLSELQVPGPPVRISGISWEPRGPAPSPGEHHNLWSESPGAPVPAENSSLDGLPLAGVRVLDMGTTLAGPAAARHLADFGAEVIKIESEVHPDTLRVGTPYANGKPGINRSAYFAAYNAGKRSFALNLQAASSKTVLRRLVESADVLMENFAPGVTRRLGITYETIRSWNPRIVMASHCLQGQTGPRSTHRGYGQIASGMTGWYDLTGPSGSEPLGPYSAYTDFISWPYLAAAILIALERREVTGKGAHIDHAQVESSIHFLAPLLLDFQLNDRIASRRGNREDHVAPNGTYRCAGDDRWVAISVRSSSEWSSLCSLLGRSDIANDPELASLDGRKAREDELDHVISEWTAGRDAFEVAAQLRDLGVAAGPVYKASDLFADAQLAEGGFFRRLYHPELGDHAVITNSFRIEGLDAGPHKAAPLLGADTYDICTQLLRIDDDTFVRYQEQGVLR